MEDVAAFLETCQAHNVPAFLERSRSGNGGHVWIFFSELIPASLARRLGSYLLTRTMEHRPEIGLDSYDRFFPNQDTDILNTHRYSRKLPDLLAKCVSGTVRIFSARG
jgi:hypothetical protein